MPFHYIVTDFIDEDDEDGFDPTEDCPEFPDEFSVDEPLYEPLDEDEDLESENY
jgi:hypothetical protein